MQIALKDGQVLLKDVDIVTQERIKHRFKLERRTGIWSADATLATLQLVERIIPNLPDFIGSELRYLAGLQAELTAEKKTEHPTPIKSYPIKDTYHLFDHQVRAYNLALMTFETNKDNPTLKGGKP